MTLHHVEKTWIKPILLFCVNGHRTHLEVYLTLKTSEISKSYYGVMITFQATSRDLFIYARRDWFTTEIRTRTRTETRQTAKCLANYAVIPFFYESYKDQEVVGSSLGWYWCTGINIHTAVCRRKAPQNCCITASQESRNGPSPLWLTTRRIPSPFVHGKFGCWHWHVARPAHRQQLFGVYCYAPEWHGWGCCT